MWEVTEKEPLGQPEAPENRRGFAARTFRVDEDREAVRIHGDTGTLFCDEESAVAADPRSPAASPEMTRRAWPKAIAQGETAPPCRQMGGSRAQAPCCTPDPAPSNPTLARPCAARQPSTRARHVARPQPSGSRSYSLPPARAPGRPFLDISLRNGKETTLFPKGTTPDQISTWLGDALRRLNPPGTTRAKPTAWIPEDTTVGTIQVQVGSNDVRRDWAVLPVDGDDDPMEEARSDRGCAEVKR